MAGPWAKPPLPPLPPQLHFSNRGCAGTQAGQGHTGVSWGLPGWSLPTWGHPHVPMMQGHPRLGAWWGMWCPTPTQCLPHRAGMDRVGLLGSLFPQLRQRREARPAQELQDSQEGAMQRPPH